jgi:nucleoside-diphosphate-sugar epimerase
MKRAVVFGCGGFIGSHLVTRLEAEGYRVRGVDVKRPDAAGDRAGDVIVGDLRDPAVVDRVVDGDVDELYQLAADMGGAAYVFSGEHDADIVRNSSLINLHAAVVARRKLVPKVFFSSSACIYPQQNQQEPSTPHCAEDSAYPADPDSEYGWEKLFAERMYGAFRKNYHIDIRIARLHNVYGPGNPWRGGREKAPAALCRKVAEAGDGDELEVWGDGMQTRSFLYIDDCIDGIRALMNQPAFHGPVNIGSEEMISLNDFARLIMSVAGRRLTIRNIPGPVGVRGRNSDNRLMYRETGWRPRVSLADGIERTYRWVEAQVDAQREKATVVSLEGL